MKRTLFFPLLVLLPLTAGFGQQTQIGLASYYADHLEGQATAFGERYDRQAYTCAHQWHPKGTLLRVTNVSNRKSVVVRVNDRGPFQEGFVVSLSQIAAHAIDLTLSGTARVAVEPVGYAEQSANVEPAANTYQPAGANAFTSRGLEPAFDSQQIRTLSPGQPGYVIQIGAYTDRQNAANQVRALQQRGVRDAYILEGANPQSGHIFRVVLGVFPERHLAESFRERLQAEYYMNGVVMKL